MDRTLTTALFILLSRGSSIRNPACNGLYLFTFTVKFRICDIIHPLSRSWNSSNDVRINSNHFCKSDERKRVHSFSCFYLHVYHDINLNTVFILILSCFWITLCTRFSTISLIFKKLEDRCVQSLLRHQYKTFERYINLSPTEVSRYIRGIYTHLHKNVRARYLLNLRISWYERSMII